MVGAPDASHPTLEHLNLFPPRERRTLNAQKQSDIKETETAAKERGLAT